MRITKRTLKLFLFSLFCILLSRRPAEGRILETVDQCVQKYGDIITQFPEKSPRFIHFKKEGIEIKCGFRNGQCQFISFQIIQTGRLNDDWPAFSTTQVQRLLTLNSAGAKWIADGEGKCHTSDGRLVADVSKSGIIWIQTKDYLDAGKALVSPTALDKTIEAF